jgi:alpha-galactosidase
MECKGRIQNTRFGVGRVRRRDETISMGEGLLIRPAKSASLSHTFRTQRGMNGAPEYLWAGSIRVQCVRSSRGGGGMWYMFRMFTRRFFIVVFSLLVGFSGLQIGAQTLAPAPPMGWNSWDSYGLTIDESAFKANATVLKELQVYGWKYAVIDEGWYMGDPDGKSLADKQYLVDKNGLLQPVASRFPSASNGAGFRPLADWVHRQGLKFGIHIVRGIPRQAVEGNLPIAETNFRADDAADKTSPCPWDEGNWGVADNAAGLAYYDAMFRQFEQWGLDFVKVDCISSRPYRIGEIKQIAEAIRKSGRRMVLSLSPGPTELKHAAEVAEYAQLWRISDDHWDVWGEPHESDKTKLKPGESGEFPFGTRDAFDRLAKWFTYAGPGSWPDEDMLPFGTLGPRPGWGKARESRLTHDEEKTELALWAIARSPLILGANLTQLDEFTRGLLSNQTILFMNQYATYSRPVDVATLGAGFEHVRVWRASVGEPGSRGYTEYFGFFNLGESAATVKTSWKQLGLDGAKHAALSAWDDTTTKESKEITVTMPAHGSQVYQVKFD